MTSQGDYTSCSHRTQQGQPDVLTEPHPEMLNEVPKFQKTQQEPLATPAQSVEPSRHGECEYRVASRS